MWWGWSGVKQEPLCAPTHSPLQGSSGSSGGHTNICMRTNNMSQRAADSKALHPRTVTTSLKVVSGSVAALQELAGGQDCNLIFWRFFFPPSLSLFVTSVSASSAQVHSNWPAPQARVWESLECWRCWGCGGLQWELSHFSSPLCLAGSKAVLVGLVLLQCSLSKLGQKWDILPLFLLFCWQKTSTHHISIPSLLIHSRSISLCPFVWPLSISPSSLFSHTHPIFAFLLYILPPSFRPVSLFSCSITFSLPFFSPSLPPSTSSWSSSFVHPSCLARKKRGKYASGNPGNYSLLLLFKKRKEKSAFWGKWSVISL